MKKFLWIVLTTLLCLSLAACAVPSREKTAQLPTLQSAVSSEITPVIKEETLSEDLYTAIYEETNPGVVAINVDSADSSGGQGSGFVFDPEGYILTNFHVIQNAQQIEIVFASGYRAEGKVVGTDLDSDLAVLSVDVPAEEIHPLVLGSSRDVKVGQTVLAIGNPYGLSGTMTVGIVSARGRLLESMRDSTSGSNFSSADLIQTDAAINPGNSGGPLLNVNGEVIGINRAIRTNGDDGVITLSNSGIGFAVPIDIVKRVIPYLIRDGEYDYPYMGIVSKEELTLSEHQKLGIPVETMGAYVIIAVKDGPAAEAGIIGGTDEINYTELPIGGDLIIAVDEQPIRSFSELLTYLVTYKSPGDEIQVTVLREGEEITLPVVLTNRPIS
jgi:S1-C subfamily serine protease